LVDKEPNHTEQISKWISSLGHSIVYANCQKCALSYLKKQFVHYVLINVNLNVNDKSKNFSRSSKVNVSIVSSVDQVQFENYFERNKRKKNADTKENQVSNLKAKRLVNFVRKQKEFQQKSKENQEEKSEKRKVSVKVWPKLS